MKYLTYEKYKPNGTDWIDKIPEDWTVNKLKYLLKSKVSDGPHETPEFIEEGIPFLSVDSIQRGEINFENCRYISEFDYKRFKVKCKPEKEDVFLGKAASIGKIARVKVDFIFSIWSPLALLRTNNSLLNPRFLEYALKSDYGQNQIENYATNNTQKNISMDDIPSIQIITPPIKIQETIAKYLDEKITRIGSLIEKDKKLIELLKEERTALINKVAIKGLEDNKKMKDSGVDWIGEIPEEWKAIRTRFVCNVNPNDKKGFSNSKTKVTFLPMEQVSEDGIYDSRNESEYQDVCSGYTYFKDRDVIVAKITPCFENGKGAVLCNLINKNGFGSTEFHVLRAFKILDERYLYYFTKTHYFRVIGEAFMQGSAGQKRVPTDFIKDFPFFLPPLPIQKDIVKYLDNKIVNIDKIVQKIEKKIELLEEHKKSLIYNVVTGKVKI